MGCLWGDEVGIDSRSRPRVKGGVSKRERKGGVFLGQKGHTNRLTRLSVVGTCF